MLENQGPNSGTTEFPAGTGAAERRVAVRKPVIKSARLLIGREINQGVLNCLILDESATGALLDLGAVYALPDEMTLNMSNGLSYKARRCWTAGTRAGLEFVGGQQVSADSRAQMNLLAELLRQQGLPATLAALRVQKFFGYEALREAAEAAEAAYNTLNMLLSEKS